MSVPAYEKRFLRNFDGSNRIGSIRAEFCNAKELASLAPEFSEGGIYSKEKIIIARDERNNNIIAALPVVDSRDGRAFIHSHKFDSDELHSKYPNNDFLEIGNFFFFDPKQRHRAHALIWQAMQSYCEDENINYVIGYVSFPGRYPAAHALALSFLYHFHRAEPDHSIAVRGGVSMDIMPEEAIQQQKALRMLPAQLRYCLRRGAKIGEGIFVDRTTDRSEILMLMPMF